MLRRGPALRLWHRRRRRFRGRRDQPEDRLRQPAHRSPGVFGEADGFVIDRVRKVLSKGLKIGSKTYSVDIIVRDSQSDPRRAAAVTQQLILNDRVDLVLGASGPEDTVPIADQAEANATPCLVTIVPYQSFLNGRGGKPFKYAYDWFGNEVQDAQTCIQAMDLVSTNKVVGVLWPNDPDGASWRSVFPSQLSRAGYTLVDPGPYQDQTNDFTAQISLFKARNVQLVDSVPLPTDWTTFWKQAIQQGFRPKVVLVSKALLFPAAVDALGPLGENLLTDAFWINTLPYQSTLTGQSAAELATDYETTTGKQWTQPLGPVHGVFEIAVQALKNAGDPKDKQALLSGISQVKMGTVGGKVDFTSGPVKDVSTLPVFVCQWQKGKGRFPYDMVVVSAQAVPELKVESPILPIPYS
jgi:branched-chain amino acid transport system substrate-binding protein